MNIRFEPSRRDLLKGTGALVVAFSVAPSSDAFAQALAPAKSVALDQVDTFLAIDSKGMVTVYIGKVDLGTGVRIAFAQIAAEELDVPLANVSVIEGDTALTPDQGPTYGSLSIQNGGATASTGGSHGPQSATRQCRETTQRRARRSCRSRRRRRPEGRRKDRDVWRADWWQEFHAESRSCGAPKESGGLQTCRQAHASPRHCRQSDGRLHVYSEFRESTECCMAA